MKISLINNQTNLFRKRLYPKNENSSKSYIMETNIITNHRSHNLSELNINNKIN